MDFELINWVSIFYLFARVGDKPTLRPLQFDVAQPNLRTKIEKSVETALPNCPQTKSAYQVLKKEIEKQKNLFFGVKFEQIPRIKNVGDNYVFEILLRTYT
ncbi:MAG TPA: hypothetical protein DCM71_20800 [Runella sp.]|nr:hypothetical protein [Runella sp.]